MTIYKQGDDIGHVPSISVTVGAALTKSGLSMDRTVVPLALEPSVSRAISGSHLRECVALREG